MNTFQSSNSHPLGRTLARTAWSVMRWPLLGAGMLLVLWSCNSHPLSFGPTPNVSMYDVDASTVDAPLPPPPVDARPPSTGGSRATTSLPPSPFGGSTGGSTGGDTSAPAGGTTTATTSAPVGAEPARDAAVPDSTPDTSENRSCPPGTVRIHVRDVWSNGANPSMKTMTTPPMSVLIIVPTGSWPSYGARQDTANCFWYSVCAPNTLTTFQIKPVGADACGGTSNS